MSDRFWRRTSAKELFHFSASAAISPKTILKRDWVCSKVLASLTEYTAMPAIARPARFAKNDTRRAMFFMVVPANRTREQPAEASPLPTVAEKAVKTPATFPKDNVDLVAKRFT